MTVILAIARQEWRLWLRSRVAILAMALVSLIIAATSLLNAHRMADEREHRIHQQAVAEQTFLEQPDRHPHRMVHYGHYVFRAPPPLSLVDPGVDSVTGQSIFLEGHRQNTPMFADVRASANLGSFQSISPAFVYQLLVPLLLISLGHGVFVRERESKTLAPLLAQGVSGSSLFMGKFLALASLSGTLLIPLVILTVIAIAIGDHALMGVGLTLGYAMYLLVWCALICVISAIAPNRGLALGVLVFIWLAWALILPRLAIASAGAMHSVPSKLETDFQMYADIRELGDGHNASDPAFTQLRANLLAQYDVERVEDLPINFRGVVAQTSEADLTTLMNEYADRRMTKERSQSSHSNRFGWVSPVIAISTASRHLSGTDLATHHRFLREAEDVRFDFVQGLNQSHIDTLSYTDDINRNRNAEAARRARISAENWEVLDRFEFTPDPSDARAQRALSPLTQLALWLIILVGLGHLVCARVKP
ncbi:DUF3526 domain-containing protein [Maricaulis sp. D1M11]|uniref:DUF3526 domain-containing protein n=1 Tax=Maricaulis sp. D1M11 TaxID=3076117 RepID=UPI0039B4CBE6